MYRLSKSSMNSIKRQLITSAQQSESILTIKEIPRPRSLPIFGTKIDFLLSGRGTQLHNYVDNRHKELGTIFTEVLSGNTELVFVSDPPLMKALFLNLEGKYPAHILPEPWIFYEQLYGSKRGLFFMNGEEWLQNRRVMNKHLLRENYDSWIESPIKETVNNFIQKIVECAINGSVIKDFESELYKLSTDVIIKVLVGANCSLSESRQYTELITMFSYSVRNIFHTTTKLYGLPLNLCYRLNLKVWTDFKECVDSSIFLARKIVNEILLNKCNTNGLIRKLSDDNVSDEAIKKIAADFVIAAGDTTAYTTMWTLLLLSENQNVLKEVREKETPYIKYVIKESMRLYPVAPFLTRILPKESYLGPYKLPKETPVIASIYTSGRDERNFSDANKFLPYRWDRNDSRQKNITNHVPAATLPFALGARSCIGKKIAMTQLVEVITQITNTFEFKFTNSEHIKPITSQVLIPNKQMEMFIKLRSS